VGEVIFTIAVEHGVPSGRVGRELFWKIPTVIEYLTYLASFIVAIIVLVAAIQTLRIWFSGTRDLSLLAMIRRAVRNLFRFEEIKLLMGSKIQRKGPYSTIMHLLIMGGILGLGLGTVIQTVHGDIYAFLYDDLYKAFSFFTDLAGVMLIIGATMALIRRYGTWKGFFSQDRRSDFVILWSILFIGLSGFLVEGFRIAAMGNPDYEIWGFGGYTIAQIFVEANIEVKTLETLYLLAWILHIVVALALVAYLPYSKLFHMFAGIGNILLMDHARPKGQVVFPTEGVTTTQSLSFQQLMQIQSCVECHRCHDVCPANTSGEPLSPMLLIRELRNKSFGSFRFGGTPDNSLHGTNGINPEALWACTTCGACQEECPLMIQHIDLIVGMRAALVLDGEEVPSTLTDCLQSGFRYGNLLGGAKRKRFDWAADLEIPHVKDTQSGILLYIGDQASYDPRNQRVARAFVQILRATNTEFGILKAKEEKNDGDTPRRLGEASMFEILANDNIKVMKKAGVTKIITISPHAYNIFQNEYPALGADFEILHYTQFLANAINEGLLQFNNHESKRIAFHDPCYLGRYNNDYVSGRTVLKALPGIELVEMPMTKDRSFCCGGGGGGMFREGTAETRPSQIRFQHAMDTNIDVLATACPFCLSMLEDAAKMVSTSKIQVQEVSEIVMERMSP
jgi:Fe-S oxidoreductase/nitrate reductase gamma subunit